MFAKLESFYHIHIEDDSFYHPLYNKIVKQYKIYTADGCEWTNGLSYRALQQECKQYRDDFNNIYENFKAKNETRRCSNCKNRCYSSMFGLDYCMGYEMAGSDVEEVENAKDCDRFEMGTPDCLEDAPYCPSSSAGDYSPSCPWNAPGMSIRDFI